MVYFNGINFRGINLHCECFFRYVDYDGNTQAEIAKWAMANGNRPASAKYNIPESTIRGFVKSYKEGKLADDHGNELQSLPRKQRGGYKLLPEEIDEKVNQYTMAKKGSKQVAIAGGISSN